MKLISIEVENFRQFQGRQRIEFASGNSNTTILFGINGTGKTGLFRAMMFGLFGSRTIEQDDRTAEVHLVNINRIEANHGSPITASVEVKFSESSSIYTIKRKISAYKKNNQIIEKEDESFLNIFSEKNSSSTQLSDPEKINKEISRVIDIKNRGFFFFDAEQIDTLSNMHDDVKEVIRKGIVQILQIELLEESVTKLDKIKAKIKAEITLKSKNTQLSSLISDQERKTIEYNDYLEKKRKIEEERVLFNEELSALNARLEQNKDIGLLQKKILEKKESISFISDALKSVYENASSSIFRGLGSLLMTQDIANRCDDLNVRLLEDQNYIPRQILEISLAEGKCVLCDSDLNQNETGKRKIHNMMHNYQNSGVLPAILLINNTNEEIKQTKKKTIEDLDEALFNINAKKEALEKSENEISDLDVDISEILNSSVNYVELVKSRDLMKKSELDFINDYASINLKIIESEEKIKKLEIQIQDLQSKEQGLKNEALKYEFLDNLQKKLRLISDEYCGTMKNALNNEVTKIFRKLIDEKDVSLVQRISVNSKYEIEVHGSIGIINQDLSQGQKQIVALSFIAGLAKLASGGGNVIDFPLFMDTPFGRISGVNRDNLIKHLPDLVSQLILLFTDTEFTNTEEKVFKESTKLGKTYKLSQVEVGMTKIEQVAIKDRLSTR